MWLAEYDIDVYNAPEVFSVPPLTRLILPVMSGRTSVVNLTLGTLNYNIQAALFLS